MSRSLIRPLVYGLLALCGLVGVATLVWSAIPQGAPVLYSADDTATVPILISPDLRSTGAFSASGSVAFSGILVPPQITSNQNDYNPTGLATNQALKLTSNAAVTITGLAAQPSGTWKTLYNGNALGSFPITLQAGPSASADANEFALSGNLILPPASGVQLQYEGTSSRWRTGSRVFLMTSVLATQSLAAGATIQHSGRTDVIEIVQIQSSTGVNAINSAATRILAGVDGQLILLEGMSATATYTIPDGNGVKWATGSSVLFDDRQSRLMEYSTSVGAWREAVTGAGGGGGGGTAASTSFAPTGGIAATNVQTAVAELDSEAEKLALKNANNGYLGLNAAGTAVLDRVGGYGVDVLLSNLSTITPTAIEMGIQGSGLSVDLISNPQIVPGTRSGQLLVLSGTHDTFTVQLDNGTGVRLCGNTGSIIIGLSGPNAIFKWNTTLNVWEQIGCPSAQQVFNTGPTIAINAFGNALNPKLVAGGGTSLEFGLDGTGAPGWKAQVAGADTDSVIQLSAGKDFFVKKSDGATLFNIDNDTGAVSGLTTQQGISGNILNSPSPCSSGGIESWFALNGRTGGSFTEAQVNQLWPVAQTLTRVRIHHAAVIPAGQTANWRVRKNGVDTSLACNVTAGTQDCTITGTESLAQDALVAFRLTCSGGSTALGDVSWGAVVQ